MINFDDFYNIFSFLKQIRQSDDPDSETSSLIDNKTEVQLRNELAKTEELFKKTIDQPVFNSDDYQRIKALFVDWYTANRFLITIQRNSSDVHSLPEKYINELFRSFGYTEGLGIVPLSSKINFFLDLVSFYKKKGTPETMIKVLEYYGYTGADLVEYWLQYNDRGELVFDPRITRESTEYSSGLKRTQIPLLQLTQDDPHWLLTEQQINDLNKKSCFKLPSKSPYFSLTSVFSLDYLSNIMGILATLLESEFQLWWKGGNYTTGLTVSQSPTYPITVQQTAKRTSLLGLYLATLYTQHILFGVGGADLDSRYNFYRGSVDLSPVVTTDDFGNVSVESQINTDKFNRVLTEYNHLTDESYYSSPWGKLVRENSLYTYNTKITKPIREATVLWDRSSFISYKDRDEIAFARPIDKAFILYSNIDELFALYDPELKYEIDSQISDGNIDQTIINLYTTFDTWIHDNLASNTPSLVISCLGFGFSGDVEKIVNFFKPYHSRLAFLDIGYQISNRLTESIRYGTESRSLKDLVTGQYVTEDTPSLSGQVSTVLESELHELELSATFELTKDDNLEENISSVDLNRQQTVQPGGIDLSLYPGDLGDIFIKIEQEVIEKLAVTTSNFVGPGWIYVDGEPVEYTDGSYGQLDRDEWMFDCPWTNDTCIIISSDGMMYHDCFSVTGLTVSEQRGLVVPEQLSYLIPS